MNSSRIPPKRMKKKKKKELNADADAALVNPNAALENHYLVLILVELKES